MRFAMLWACLALASCWPADASTSEQTLVSSVTVVATFTSDTGTAPRGGLSLGPDGRLWGAAWQRGPNRVDPDATHTCSSTGAWDTDYQGRFCPGTVFRVDPATGAIDVVHAFTSLDDLYHNADGYQPSAAPVHGGDGWMYGTATKGGAINAGTIYRVNAQTFEFQTLSSLGAALGRNPYARLEPDGRGGMYLMVKNGSLGAGVLLRLDLTTLALAVVHQFGRPVYTVTPNTNIDGGNPFASPVVGWDGHLHVRMPAWGQLGGGTIDTIATDGTTVVDAAFAPVVPPLNADQSALGALTVARDGRIFGAKAFGGANATGVLFRTDADGSNYVELYSCEPAFYTSSPRFGNGTCAEPMSTLLEDYDGSLLGTAFYGGANGFGSVYRIDPDGASFDLLYSFTGGVLSYPPSGVMRGCDGEIYGVTQSAGGVLYKLEASP
jgi:uncharacterized repeat protein (TIGR03803 family)